MTNAPEGFKPLTFKLFEALDEGDLLWKNGQYSVLEAYDLERQAWPYMYLPNRDDITDMLTSRYLDGYYVYTKGISRLRPFDPLEGLIAGDTVALKSGRTVMKKSDGFWAETDGSNLDLESVRINMATPPYVIGYVDLVEQDSMNLNLYDWIDKHNQVWYHNGTGWYIEGMAEGSGLGILDGDFAPYRRKDCIND